MDLKKSGRLIAAQRKELGKTQKELADILGVTDKAVSRWETGQGFPDSSLLIPLAETLGIAVADLINGEVSPPETTIHKSDGAIVDAFIYAKEMTRKTLGTTLLVLGALGFFAPFFVVGTSVIHLFGVGGALTLAGLLVLCLKPTRKKIQLPEAVAGAFALTSLGVALVLELIPYGAVLIFASGPEKMIRETYSYFSLIPFGYANFFPLSTALMTLLISIVLLIKLVRGRLSLQIQNAAFIMTVLAILCSIAPAFLFGIGYVTPVGVAISLCLLLSVLFQAFANRK